MADDKIKEAAAEVAAKLATEIYTDGFKPLTKEVGDTLGTVGSALNASLGPVRILVAAAREWEQATTENITEIMRRRRVPNERIIPPSPRVLLPALPGLVSSESIPTLREKYTALLAAAMDKNTESKAHPGFVALLDQLAEDEALIVDLLAKKPLSPVIRMIAVYASTGRKYAVSRNFSLVGIEAGCRLPEMAQIYIGNLNRLGVTAVEVCECAEEHGNYEALKAHPMLLREKGEYDKTLSDDLRREQRIEYVKYHLRLTNFGTQLVNVCVVNTA